MGYLISLLGTSTVVSTGSGPTGAGGGSGLMDGDPGGSIHITTAQNPSTVVSDNSSGSIFYFEAGTHRPTAAITPKNDQQFWAHPSAVINGAKVLQSSLFEVSGGLWRIGGQTQQNSTGEAGGLAKCFSSNGRCEKPEDVWIDGVLLKHSTATGTVTSSRFFFDYTGDYIYIGQDPAGKLVETSWISTAIDGSATGVTFQNLTIKNYASTPQYGAIAGGANWTFTNCDISGCHSFAIGSGHNRTVDSCRLHHNGQMGIGGKFTGGVVKNCEIDNNNVAGFDYNWEAGGSKFARSTGLLLSSNYVHNNYGPGLWCDIDNVDVTYTRNVCSSNGSMGIFHEISYNAVISTNTCDHNGLDHQFMNWPDGSGILVATSKDVEVFGNTCSSNWQGLFCLSQTRGSGDLGAWLLRNCNVHNNTVITGSTFADGTALSGVYDQNGVVIGFSTANVKMDSNTYDITGPRTKYFWSGGDADLSTTFAAFQADGFEASGSVI